MGRTGNSRSNRNRRTLKSRRMTAQEKALGFPRSSLATHTEARAVGQTLGRERQVAMAMVEYICDEDLNFEGIVVLDEDCGDSPEVQRALEFDDQDVELGMDTYCLVRGDASFYGGLLSFAVFDDRISFQLSDQTAETLQLPASFEVPMETSQPRTLEAHLLRLTAR
jgi:hypothetical protein